MKVFRSTPWVLAAESCCRPEPRTKRKSSGWTSEVTIRMRSFRKRISSRRQTILIARSSERQLRGGTRTVTTGGGRRRRDASGRRRRSGRARLGAHRRPSHAITRRGCGFSRPDSLSASRIVEPVWDMKTSSRVGRERLTDLIGTPSSAKSRGTNSSPSATAKLTTPSETVASRPKRSPSAAIAASSSAVSIRIRSAPTCFLQRLGVSRATISPWSMIAMRPQNSASSM